MTEPGRRGRDRQVRRAARVRAADGDVDLAGRLVRGDPVEEERGAVGVLRLGGDAVGQRRGHGCDRAAALRRAGTRRTRRCRQVLVVAGVLPVAVEHEHAFALAEAGIGVGVLDRVGVLREVAGLDPLLQVLGGREVRRRVDGRAGLLEDPVVDRLGRPVGGHQVLEREREPAAAGRGVPGHDRLQPGCLGLGEQVLELGDASWAARSCRSARPAPCCRRRRSGCS